jgi:hypothetical protein
LYISHSLSRSVSLSISHSLYLSLYLYLSPDPDILTTFPRSTDFEAGAAAAVAADSFIISYVFYRFLMGVASLFLLLCLKPR